MRPTPESLAIKEKNRKARQAKKELEKEVADEITSVDDGDQIARLTLMIEKLSKQREGLQQMIESTRRGIEKERGTTYHDTTVPLRGQAVNANVQKRSERKVCNLATVEISHTCRASDDLYSFGKPTPTAKSMDVFHISSTNTVLSSTAIDGYVVSKRNSASWRKMPRVTDVKSPCTRSMFTPGTVVRPQGPWAQVLR